MPLRAQRSGQWADGEYAHGPNYVGEFILQIDANLNPQYILQDANYNVVATLNDNSATSDPPDLLAEYTYTPYGQPIFVEDHTPHRRVNAGHQGLFFDRLDADPDAPAIEADATGLYQNRNRAYAPAIGRFLQQDPNETGQLLLQAHANQGAALEAQVRALSLDGLFGDGPNLFSYAGNNAVNRLDPAGLSIWEDVDDAIAGIVAEKVAFAEQLAGKVGISFNTAKLMGELLFSLLPGSDAIRLVGALAQGQDIGYGDVAMAAVSLVPGSGAGKVAAKVFGKLRKLRKAYKSGKIVAKLINHHTVPKAVLRRLAPEVASHRLVRGIKGAPNRWKIPEDIHKTLHSGGPESGLWNARWWKELGGRDKADEATVDKVLAIRDKLIRELAWRTSAHEDLATE